MAALQEALEGLAPISWAELPQNPPDLRAYINDLAAKARLIADSVPEPAPQLDENPSKDTSNSNSNSSSSASSSSTPSAPRIISSPARLSTTTPTNNPDLQSLQREWGKPSKISNPRDNPLDISIHKLSGADGKGSWFARRSVHAGLPYSTWQTKLSSEMGETLRANSRRLAKGKTPDQSVRGIGAEKRVEEIEVRDGDDSHDNKGGDGGDILAHVNVFHVSAQFPKPTTPRDFVAFIVDWGDGASGEGRSWMMVSKPCAHPDVPVESGYIRGQYESVEMIREIPVNGRGGDGDGDGEANPVEWIMVTRSDPGGSIPRWMVEKGTPKSICTDAGKFAEWACREDGPAKDEADGEGHHRSSDDRHEDRQAVAGVEGEDEDGDESDSDISVSEVEHHGLIASFAYLLNAGLDRYAPQAVLDYLPRQGHHISSDDDDDGDSITSHEKSPRASTDSLPTHSTPQTRRKDTTTTASSDARSQTSHGGDKASAAGSTKSGLATPLENGHPDIPSVESMKKDKKGKLTSHEKQLIKLAERKRDVETQLEKVRADIQALTLPPREEDLKRDRASAAALAAAGDPSSDQVSSSGASSSTQKKSSEEKTPEPQGKNKEKSKDKEKEKDTKKKDKDAARMHKVASGLFNDESKLVKQLGKIERDQLKEAGKIEARLQKQADREDKARSRTETESLRHEVDHLKKEVERLRAERQQWLDLVGSLQQENTRLAQGSK